MCGIAGIAETGKDNRKLMDRMLDMISHRGPDAVTQFANGDVVLGHRRLSIIDLNTGDQPMFNEDKSLCIIFNGEIYNYKNLREILRKKGHVFATDSDTEVLLHGYEEFGHDLYAKLNGIFAFALYDIRKDKIVLVRDQFGVKPLHYYFRNNLFVFASEQKSILLHPSIERKLNLNSLHSQINLRYTQRDETLFEGIRRLPPAHFLEFKENSVSIKNYWQLVPEIKKSMSEGDAIEGINYYLKQAVGRQLMSDVPLGVYLSGGMDSSAIVQKMSELGVDNINTFTLGFNEPTDEFPDSELIARQFNTNHRTLSLSMEPLRFMPEVIWHAEEPKINLLQGYNMSGFVGEHVKVVLGGLGGDELFAGYDIHKFIFPFNNWHRRIPDWMKKIAQWKSDLLFRLQNSSHTFSLDEYRRGIQMLLSIGNIEKFYLILRNVWDFDKDFYKEIYHPDIYRKMLSETDRVEDQFAPFFNKVKDLSSLDQVLFTEFHSKMVNDYLLVEDRMSMSHSVEERVPFLDIDLVNFGFSIPVHLKIKNNQTKYLFRKAMKGKLPDKIIEKKKWGFTVNPYLQFKKDLRNTAGKLLTRKYINEQGIFNYNYIRKILNYPPNPRLRWHYNYIWVLSGLALLDKLFITTDNFIDRKFELEEYYNI
ncbi:MAG: asparagine synthase (glutamine-hydrolyzing) [Melioribacteraceae bacterium]|nr:asparagine synthase (glutamine-hydrolyzing) [Melioribacteraceae bacterium]